MRRDSANFVTPSALNTQRGLFFFPQHQPNVYASDIYILSNVHLVINKWSVFGMQCLLPPRLQHPRRVTVQRAVSSACLHVILTTSPFISTSPLLSQEVLQNKPAKRVVCYFPLKRPQHFLVEHNYQRAKDHMNVSHGLSVQGSCMCRKWRCVQCRVVYCGQCG